MTFLVPYDGSDLARAALVRADEYADALDEGVTAVSVIPESERYAKEKGWIGREEAFEPREVAGDLHQQALDLAPEASFRIERVDGGAGAGTVATTIRRVAADVDASVVFLGSENAGRIVVPVTSVGGSVAADTAYDVHVVRRRLPPKVASIRPRSDYYVVD